MKQSNDTMKIRLMMVVLISFSTLLASGSRAGERVPATEPITFSNDTLTLKVRPGGTVQFFRDGKRISQSSSKGWSIYQWVKEVRTSLPHVQQTGPNQIKLWSRDGRFEVDVAITPKDRHFTFELLHVSNNPSGGLDDDWPGHRVEFDVRTMRPEDGFRLNTIRLNPMSELSHRWNYYIDDGIFFSWPYPQWSQTEDRPQPQGLVGVFGYVTDEEHDDILADIWAAEPSLPRPNRAQLTSWTRADVDRWLDECETYYGTPMRTLSFSPIRMTDTGRGWEYVPESLYPAADLAAAAGMNAIYLSQHSWQDHNIGRFKPDVFPGGREDAIAWRKHCDALGIHLHFHGFSHLIRKPDPAYGWGVVHEDLARSARGTLLHDVPAEAAGMTILVEPDLDYYIGMKEGMLPFYDINKLPEPQDYNGGRGGTFPPYYENLSSLISINKNLYRYTVSLTEDNKWRIVLDDSRWALQSKTPLVDHKAGDTVEFILANANGNYFLPDSRSDLLVQQAIGYAQLLNDVKTGDGYDGSAWTEDLGSWGLRKFSQEVYERMDHPGGGGSAFGIWFFGHFEMNFKRIRKAKGERGGHIPVFLAESAMLAPSFDNLCKGAGNSSRGKDLGLRAVHGGLTLEMVENYGLWNDAGAMLQLWCGLKPHLTKEQVKTIRTAEAFYVASETEGEWRLTRHQAMRREGIDSAWNQQPERPGISPRQFLKADGKALEGLHNPYGPQEPMVEIHVMSNMAGGRPENTSLMPTNAAAIINPPGAEQTLAFEEGGLRLSVDNRQADQPYEYYASQDTVGHWLQPVDMRDRRGVAITVVGDGSGSTLVLATGGFSRMYAVDIDFVGERTIEIPNGEAVNNREGWNIYKAKTITQFRYERVDRFRLFLQKVPAGKHAGIVVKNIEAMHENRRTGLVDPVLTFNGVQRVVEGTVPCDHYLVLARGDGEATVFDPNWNFVKKLPARGKQFVAVEGGNQFSVRSAHSPETWLSARLKVNDEARPIVVPKP